MFLKPEVLAAILKDRAPEEAAKILEALIQLELEWARGPLPKASELQLLWKRLEKIERDLATLLSRKNPFPPEKPFPEEDLWRDRWRRPHITWTPPFFTTDAT